MPFGRQPLLDDGQQTDYAGQLEILHDGDLVKEVETQVYDAGWDARTGPSDQRASICYREAERREKPWLYVRGWVAACDRAMVPVDATDRAKAREPVTLELAA